MRRGGGARLRRRGRGRLDEPVQERHAHRARRADVAHRRVPAREAGQGRRVRAHEAEGATTRAPSSTAPSAPARSSRASAPRTRTCSTSTTPATRSSSWTRRPTSSSRCRARRSRTRCRSCSPRRRCRCSSSAAGPPGSTCRPSVVLEVTDTEPGVKGDTVSNVTKPATLETGGVVQVPLFVERRRQDQGRPAREALHQPRLAGLRAVSAGRRRVLAGSEQGTGRAGRRGAEAVPGYREPASRAGNLDRPARAGAAAFPR